MKLWKVSAFCLGTQLEAIVCAESSVTALEIITKSDSMYRDNAEVKEIIPQNGSILIESSRDLW